MMAGRSCHRVTPRCQDGTPGILPGRPEPHATGCGHYVSRSEHVAAHLRTFTHTVRWGGIDAGS